MLAISRSSPVILGHITFGRLVSQFPLDMLRTMPLGIILLVFGLIFVCLGVLVRWEYRRLIRTREAQMFERLYKSEF